MRDIPILDADIDRTHDAGGDPIFQESSLIVWHDLKAGVGGVWRVSQEPVNRVSHSCFGVFAPDGRRFRHNVQSVPMDDDARGAHHMSPVPELRLDLATMSIEADFPDCEARLRFEDFHPRYDFLSLMRFDMPEGHGGEHIEVAGRVTGRLRIGAQEYEIDALAHRDRSWGPRHWGTLLATRWWPMVFGPDLAMIVMANVHSSGDHGCIGYVMRDGVPTLMSEADIGVLLDYDAVGARRAETRFTLEPGETMELVHERTSGVVLDVKSFFAVESIGTVRLGERIGMSNIEVYTNAHAGTTSPRFVMEADAGQGLSQRHG